jgi:glycine cleavage system aminomethyltransferase T
MRVEDTPFHISGLEKFVELDQSADFVGKDALIRVRREGVDRKLVGIDIRGDPMTDEGALNDTWPVRDDRGERIGHVTAGAWSPRLERNVGYAWVPSSHTPQGTEVALRTSAGERRATVASLPFWDPNKDIPKG